MDAVLSTQLSFDYAAADIPAVESKQLEKHAEVVLRTKDNYRKNGVSSVMEIGEELVSARKRLSNHKNGTFGKWCQQRIGITSQTARNAITVYECCSGKYCKTVLQYFDLSALYALTADSCPEEAFKDAIKAATKGELITKKRAKELIGARTIDEDQGKDESDADFDPTDAIEKMREFVKHRFIEWPKKRRKLLLSQLRQLADELDDPNILNAEELD